MTMRGTQGHCFDSVFARDRRLLSLRSGCRTEIAVNSFPSQLSRLEGTPIATLQLSFPELNHASDEGWPRRELECHCP